MATMFQLYVWNLSISLHRIVEVTTDFINKQRAFPADTESLASVPGMGYASQERTFFNYKY
jgi:hypothetical protein